jgi:hypothetical protein
MKMWHSATTNNLVIQVTNTINRFVENQTNECYRFGQIRNQLFRHDKSQNTGVLFKYAGAASQMRSYHKLFICGGWDEITGCHGFGKCLYFGGCEYEGMYEYGKHSGFGVMKFLNGTTYSGNWLYDYQHGRGTMKSIPGGFSYDGYWRSERPHGWGVITYDTGETLQADCWNGHFTTDDDEHGQLRLLNGDLYAGHFDLGYIYGEGSAQFHNGDKFEGKFVQRNTLDLPELPPSFRYLPGKKGEWFNKLDYMIGAYTKFDSNTPVWGKWKPPDRTTHGGVEQWSTGLTPLQ